MNKFYNSLTLVSILAILGLAYNSLAQDPQFEQRRSNYISSAIANPGGGEMVLQSYAGVPVNLAILNQTLNNISTGVTADFDIIELIRIMCQSPGQYDTLILPVLNQIPFWVNDNDTVRNYWSENHMIMWSGSEWLLHERFNRPVPPTLRDRIVHYLHLKIDYGFYEFFSSVYGPYSMSGMINLADFAQDVEIKALATQATQKILSEFVMLTNSKGTYFPVAGRNYSGKYDNPYGQSHNNLIYLLTGKGEVPGSPSHGGQFLATTTINVDNIVNSWVPNINMVMHNGHSIAESFALNSTMTEVDKTVFQWSYGGYFHPDVVSETVQLLIDSNLWDQVDFAILHPLQPIITPASAPSMANQLSYISKSSVLCDANIAIFKRNAVTLTSVIDFWKGKVGFQQHPNMANVGTTAVYLGSGQPFIDWGDRSANSANTHLPYVNQHSNVSLLMYRPEPTGAVIGPSYAFKEVALHFVDTAFDEIVENGNWILGREDQGYVAVRRHCVGEINGVRACPADSGQAWVVMVGDSSMYGSFANFSTIVGQSQFSTNWHYDSLSAGWVYYAKIVVDTTTIEYAWGDTNAFTGINALAINAQNIKVFPNPANEFVSLDLSQFPNSTVRLFNTFGQQVFEAKDIKESNYKILTSDFNAGIYLLKVESGNSQISQKLILAK